ncbi:MAG: DNA polymerase/3'-5' exonuclease PolX [Hydrogenibacillus sp.]|nr:DNA polymerase/3'-5' exonuclease PolX [Hydrogenibacillus sp.]
MDVTNRYIARVLEKIADYSEILGENAFKVRSYRRAAQTIESLDVPIAELLDRGEAIPGIGKGIGAVVREILEHGESPLLKALEEKVPKALIRLLAVPGIGPKTVGKLIRELDIDSEAKLEQAIQAQKIRALPGFGAKIERRIAEALRAAHDPNARRPLADMAPIAREICRTIARLPGVDRCEIAGSIRRVSERPKDVDLVVATRQAKTVAEAVREVAGTGHVTAFGPDKVSFTFEALWPIPVDVRFVAPEQYGSALLHFTGSRAHNIFLRQRAKMLGLKLNEYGLSHGDGRLETFADEAALYARLGLPYVSPELRDDAEIFAPARVRLLDGLISSEDIRGDLHMHTRSSDGGNTIEEMARAAYARGYRYIAVTDHSASLKVAGGLSVERLKAQVEEVRRIETRLSEEWGAMFYIFAGTEVDILPDGTLDYPDEVLAALDFVVASVHTSFRQSRETMTARLLSAVRHPYVDLIAHPTGRLIGRREAYAVDMEAVIEAAARYDKVLELNASPYRLDLNVDHLRLAAQAGVKIAISTDAHNVSELEQMHLGVQYARKALIPRSMVQNAMDPEALIAYLSRNRGKIRPR